MFLFKNKKTKKNSENNSSTRFDSKLGKHTKTKNTKHNSDTSISINNNTLKKYISAGNTDMIHPKYWELPSRKHFYNWVMETFPEYEIGNKKQKKHEPRLKEHFELHNIQRLTRDYLQGESPVRGLLLFLGLGVGKTCAGVTIAEGILTHKNVIVISKAALDPNWVKGIKECGADYVRNHNYWVFKSCDTDEMRNLAKYIGIPQSIININHGIFLVDFTKTSSNLNELTAVERDKLDLQIDAILENRYTFIHSDATSGIWDKKIHPDTFNNKIIIVDEIHNLGNTMASKSKNGAMWYERFMTAKNAKIIFLSGTPIINRIFEITKIFNILRGYMPVLEISFKSTFDTSINYDKIIYNLKQNKHIDQIIKNKAKKIIKITQNPTNFITSVDGKMPGLLYRPNETITPEQFHEEITTIIQKMGYKAVIEWQTKPATVFPEDEEKFEQLFYNKELNKLKHIDLIKRRIVGLTSYYEYKDTTNYPKLLPINIVAVPMSEYQFGKYETYRHREIEEEKFTKRRVNLDKEEPKSSYRISSRLACSFVFPEETGSPYDGKGLEYNMELIENLAEEIDTFQLRVSQAEQMKLKDVKARIKTGFLDLLEKDKDKYLDIKNGSLAKYSPKYLSLLLNVKKQISKGKIFIYSQFSSLIGLNALSLALEQTGDWAMLKIKKVNKMWELNMTKEEMAKNKYIFYTGGQKDEELPILINIINSEWDKMPSECEKLIKQLRTIHTNNYRGDIIKMIMTTKKGSEGLDLKEIRFIHIIEPYWQNVLIQQIIGRGVRNKSHLTLPLSDRDVEVFIYMATITPNLVRKITYVDVRNDIYKHPNPAIPEKANKVISSDEFLYLTSKRKEYIINEFQKLMKESAFDCSLNFKENKMVAENKGLVCMDYDTKSRDEYIYTPDISDTVEGMNITQDKIVAVKYGQFKHKANGKTYYFEMEPNAMGKMFIYGSELKDKTRLPKPVGEVKILNGVRKFYFKTTKSLKSKK